MPAIDVTSLIASNMPSPEEQAILNRAMGDGNQTTQASQAGQTAEANSGQAGSGNSVYGDKKVSIPVGDTTISVTPHMDAQSHAKMSALLTDLGIEPADPLNPAVLEWLVAEPDAPLVNVDETGQVSINQENFEATEFALDRQGVVPEESRQKFKEKFQQSFTEFKINNGYSN